jgi:hypothetical protein
MKLKRKEARISYLTCSLQNRFAEEKEKRKKIETMTKVEMMKSIEQRRLKGKLRASLGNRIRKKIKIIDLLISILIIINLGLSIHENNMVTLSLPLDININNPEKVDYNAVNNLKYITLGVIIVIELFLIWKYYLNLYLLRMDSKASKNDNIITSGLWTYFWKEFIILAIFPPPKMNFLISGKMLFGQYTYNTDSLVLVLSMTKLYYFSKLFNNFSIWKSKKVAIIGRENQVSVGTAFVFKAQLKQRPYITLLMILVFLVLVFSFIIRIFEYSYTDDEKNIGAKHISNGNFKRFSDNVWLVIITMLTIGYGETVPGTHFGRAIAAIAAVFGMLVISTLIVTLSSVVDLNRHEKMAYNLIKKRDIKKTTKYHAANLIARIFETYVLVTRAKEKRNNIK